jgi:hypothetical protein
LRETVERLPIRPKYTNVLARSENEGSGTAASSLPAAGPACFLLDVDDEDTVLAFRQPK